MKTPTKKELQALAVRALGEGAAVEVEPLDDEGLYPAFALAAPVRAGASVYVYARPRPAAMRALAAALRALEADACAWTADDDGNWLTGCGGMFVLETGTPKDNEMAWCCYCGRALAGEE